MKRLLKMYAMFAVICMIFALGACSHSSSGGSDSDESDAGNGGNGTGSLAESLAGTSWTSSSKTLDFSTDGTVIYFNGSDYSKGEYYDYTGDTQGEGVAVFLKQWSSDDKSYSDSNNWWGFFVTLKSDGTLYAQEFSWVDSGYALDGYAQDTYTKSQSITSGDTGGEEGDNDTSSVNFPHEDDTPDLFAEIETYDFEGTVEEAATYIGTLMAAGTYSIKITETADSFSSLSTAMKNLNNDNIYVLLDLSETKAEKIGASEFQKCTALYSVKLPDTVKTIVSYSFYGCTSLKYIIIPSSVEEIRSWSFPDCTSLESIYIPSSVTIQTDTFRGCTSLKKATTAADGIGASDFYGCTSLTEVYIAKTVTVIMSYAFDGCPLTSVVFENPNGWKYAGGSSKKDVEEDLSDPSIAAAYLLSDTARNLSWSED